MTKIQNTDNTKCRQRCGATGTLINCWWECKMVQTFWKTVWQFLTKLNILLAYDSTIVLFRYLPKGVENMSTQITVHRCL